MALYHWSYWYTFCRLFFSALISVLTPEMERKMERKMEKTIGQRIKECRKKMGMTQEELADALYIPKTTVSSYERDVVDMKMGIIKELAKVLHTTVGYLIDGEKVELDGDVMQVTMMMQEMPVELRRVAMEQVKLLAAMNISK